MRKGSKQTEESKAKIRLSKTGKKFTQEHSQAISTALRGLKKTELHKKAISKSIKASYVRKAAIGERDPDAFMRAEIEELKLRGEH